jgi:hypothetical protein
LKKTQETITDIISNVNRWTVFRFAGIGTPRKQVRSTHKKSGDNNGSIKTKNVDNPEYSHFPGGNPIPGSEVIKKQYCDRKSVQYHNDFPYPFPYGKKGIFPSQTGDTFHSGDRHGGMQRLQRMLFRSALHPISRPTLFSLNLLHFPTFIPNRGKKAIVRASSIKIGIEDG